MEGSESGAVVPSDLEAETWVKIWNFPAEFLFADDISLLVSSFGSVVGTDVDTYEKMQNHLRPSNLRRKLHSSTTFVTIFVRVSVTKPLPSRVAVGSKKGREFIIGLDFDPTPKVCLLCHGAGHFDFECCSTDKESVEIIAEAGGGFDGFCADFHGEQGAVSTDGLHSYEDTTVAEAALMVDSHFLPAASCEFGAAAAPELMPLLPATDFGVQGTLISEGSGSFEDPPVLVVDPMILPLAPGIVGAAATDLSPVGEAELAEDLHHFEQVFSVVNCPKKHQKWRDKSDVQGLFSSQLQGMADPYMIDVQASSGVNKDKKYHLWWDLFDEHHKWRDKSVVLGLWCDTLEEQGMFSFEILDLLLMLSSLLGNLATTYYVQVFFQIHHKWREKGY